MEQASRFIIGIILARLLLPEDFGVVGMVTVFIVVSQSFVDSGFGQALIQKRDACQRDYSTAFFFNIVIAVVIFFALLLSSDYIAVFMKNAMIGPVLRVISIAILINSSGVIQRAILIRRIDFKTQTWIQIASNLSSGGLAIFMAVKGFGVWSLVFKFIAKSSVDALLLWLLSKWRPSLEFCWKSFREMFSFGGKILISDIINKLYRNLYYFIIGRYFSAADLGFYTRAEQFEQLPSNILTLTIQRVTYPVLCRVSGDGDYLQVNFRILFRNIAFLVLGLMAILFVVAEPLVLVLIGKQWLPSVEYLRLLSLAGMVVPLSYLNINLLKVKGRTDILLRLEILKKIIAIPIVIFSIQYGVSGLIYGLISASIIEFCINSNSSGRLIGYGLCKQVLDILPFMMIAALIVVISKGVNLLVPDSMYLTLVVPGIIGFLIMGCAGYLLKLQTIEIMSLLGRKACARLGWR